MSNKPKISRRRFLALGTGAAAGALVGYAIGNPLQGFFAASEEAQRDFQRIYQFNRGNHAYLENILTSLPENTRTTYSRNNGQRDSVFREADEYLQSLERQSLKTPLTAPEKKLVESGEGILEWTKGLWSKKKKEEAGISADPNFQRNYNALGALRVSLKERIAGIEEGMDQTAYRLMANEHNTHGVDKEGRKLLAELFSEHEKSFALLREFKALTPEQVLQGQGNPQYDEMIQMANAYEIRAYEPTGFLSKNTSLMGAAVLGLVGAWAGNFVAGKGAYAVRTTTGAIRDLGRLSAKPVTGIIGLVKRMWQKDK